MRPDYWMIIEKIGSRYFVVAGIAFLIFYVLLRKQLAYKKIQLRFPKNSDFLREAGFSLLSIAIFPVYMLVLTHPTIAPYTTRYTAIQEYGWFYYFALFPVLFVLHDAYFYWTHRAMHHPDLFKWFHLVHHKSTNPSPWAAYAFHPLEALVENGIVAVFFFTVPIHITQVAIFFLLSIIYNVYGHLGYELYPKGFQRSLIGKWINTSVNHNMHHQYFKGNYGLYFLWWDRWMGTIRPDYEERFDEVKNRTASAPAHNPVL